MNQKKIYPSYFILLPLVLYVVFFMIPSFMGLALSTTDWNAVNDQIHFVDVYKRQNGNYQKALRFADGTYRDIVSAYNQAIVDRIENERLDGIYKQAKETMEKGGQFNLRNAQVKFERIKDYLCLLYTSLYRQPYLCGAVKRRP